MGSVLHLADQHFRLLDNTFEQNVSFARLGKADVGGGGEIAKRTSELVVVLRGTEVTLDTAVYGHLRCPTFDP